MTKREFQLPPRLPTKIDGVEDPYFNVWRDKHLIGYTWHLHGDENQQTSLDVDERTEQPQDRWIIRWGFFIPRKYREGWLGDLLEDREEMRRLGFKRFRIEAMTAGQLLNYALLRPGTWFVAAAAWLVNKIKFL